MTFFETANYVEAALWAIIGLEFLRRTCKRTTQSRHLTLFVAVAFILFGLSDVVEVYTGAWWRPWWLLIWKGACLVSFVLLLVAYRTQRRENRQDELPKDLP
ncbi:MAG: hypothetical protein JSV78_09680 [Phycisphaerales bacterium]|nr:MAG: hypothetical protein JSV78_09680 [Phycisphaerales bacterium]